MKIYYEPTHEDIADLISLCRKRRWPLILLRNKVGRPITQPCDDITVQKVLNTYNATKNYRETARRVGLNPGVVWRIVNNG